ncbi:MAG: 6-phosphogluconolactonase [Acidimicrobiia bacterium]|jgi:6-phosphogluconolactonase|nr:6-phosphogluconolactonase [Acidimicrobiia bacterium]
MQLRVRVFDNADILADIAATAIARALQAALADHDGPVSLFLSGGSTPRVTYTRLVDQDVDWSRVHVFLGDERWVDSEHQDSNARMAREAFIEDIEATFHVLPTHFESPHEAADHYEQALAELFGSEQFRADLVILGIGTDGHTASLFPGTEALDEAEKLFVANWVPDKEMWRLSATFRLLHHAAAVMFLATGEAKAEVVAQILEGEGDYPARRVMEGAADVTWYLDRAAAAHLSDEFRANHA